MPLERLIDLLAEAAVRKLSQQREKQEAAPDETPSIYKSPHGRHNYSAIF